MIFNEEKKYNIEVRDCLLDIQLVALRQYKKTGDKKYLDYAKDFGTVSKKFSNKINGTAN